MGLSFERAIGAMRLSLGRGTTESEIEDAARLILDAAKDEAQSGVARSVWPQSL